MLPNGVYTLKSGRSSKFCADEGDKIRCNRDTVGGWEKFTINKEGDKYTLRGGKNGKLCAYGYNGKMVCNRNIVQPIVKFEIEKQGNQFSLKGGDTDKKYCTDDGYKIICNRDTVGDFGKFTIVKDGANVSTNQRCGPEFNNTICPGKQCCSEWNWCAGTQGTKSAHCYSSTNKGRDDGKYDGIAY